MPTTDQEPTFYDDPHSFERYRNHRHSGVTSPNFVMEEPAVREQLGSVAGLRVLDLGCGDGTLGRALLEAGCRTYLGIDNSTLMVEAAREALRGTAGEVAEGDIESLSATRGSYDLIVSCLALHYVSDLTGVLRRCEESLAPNGRLVLTVVHPVISSHEDRGNAGKLRTNWVVDNYFNAGPRHRKWMGSSVIWHHRTIEDYVLALQHVGFTVDALRECAPRRDRFGDDEAEFARRQRVPLFLLLAASRR